VEEPLAESTPFDLASLTKPLCTALLLALLERDGVVDPDEPVGDVLEPMRGSAHHGATLLDLAAHAGGLAAWRPLYLRARDLGGYLESIARTAPAVSRGETLYSDLGYIALGAAIERRAGASLDRLFAERIAAPAGLARTGFAAGGRFRDAAATERGCEYECRLAGDAGRGYPWPREVLRGEVHDGNARAIGGVAGHAGLFGPVDEVARIAREILCPERLPLDERARSRLLSETRAGGGRTAGLVLAGHATAARGVLPAGAPGHTGFTGTSVWLDPDEDALYVLLTNRVHPAVDAGGFQAVRRGFHRLARRAVIAARAAGGGDSR
jgi:CubicO group peptidase (beta-lactamase class C family)